MAPGWVDLHSHSDLTLLSDGRAVSKVAQGVTTEVNGNCGMGGVPLPPAVADLTRAANATIDPDRAVRVGLDGPARATSAHSMTTGLAINTAPLIGHLPLRIAVAGEAARPLDDAERRCARRRHRRLPRRRRGGRVDGADVPAGDVRRPRRARGDRRGRSRVTTGCSRSTCATTATDLLDAVTRGARRRAGERAVASRSRTWRSPVGATGERCHARSS